MINCLNYCKLIIGIRDIFNPTICQLQTIVYANKRDEKTFANSENIDFRFSADMRICCIIEHGNRFVTRFTQLKTIEHVNNVNEKIIPNPYQTIQPLNHTLRTKSHRGIRLHTKLLITLLFIRLIEMV